MSPRAWCSAIVCSAILWASGALLVELARAHVPGCHSRTCDQRIHHKRRQHWKRLHIWEYLWHHLTAHERSWARCIASYETRGIPWAQKAATNTGNGYGGSTQWRRSTWHAAGGRGDVWDSSLHEQLVRTVRWAHVAGSSQWSTSRKCGSV